MKKYIFASITLLVVFLIFIPYFTSHFKEIRTQKEIEENRQRIQKKELAREKAKKEAEEKIYLLGRFDPSQRQDFIPVPPEYNVSGYKMYLRKETLAAFIEMESVAKVDDVDLNIVSATRNFDYQKNLWNNKWSGVTFVEGKNLSESIPDGNERFLKILEYSAAPGTSRHHWGTDIDIGGANPKYFDTEEGIKEYAWLIKNASAFGFCQTYNEKSDQRTTGYNEEKWHWSYLPLSRNFTKEYKDLVKDEDITGFLGAEWISAPNVDIIYDYVLSINPECL